MSSNDFQKALDAYQAMYSGMTPASLHDLDKFFTEDAVFQDPFNHVKGVDAIRGIFRHMYETCEDPRFSVISTSISGNIGWIHWVFMFGLKGRQMDITGASMIMFADDGRVMTHVDYWDAASQLYEKLPVIGWLVKKLRQLFAAPDLAIKQLTSPT